MLDNNQNIKTVISLGYFDSVHNGHRKVISTARKYADEKNAKLVVFTFGGNLKAVLRGEDEKSVYMPNEREILLKELGADEIYFAPVDFNFLSIGKLAFLNLLNRKYNICCYVSGTDYRFGKFGKGNVDDIKRFAGEKGQDVIIVDDVEYGDKKISTTRIKKLLESGDVKGANVLLGKPYFISGTVFEDRKIGHELGFPTVNINLTEDKFRLKDGVYQGRVNLDGKSYKTVINYGARPTFNLNEKLVEAHIIGFNGCLYGKEIILYVDAFIREIQKFKSRDELMAQLAKDCLTAGENDYD